LARGLAAVFVAAVVVLAKKAVPLAAHSTAHHHVNLTASNILGQDEAHQLRHDLLHLPPLCGSVTHRQQPVRLEQIAQIPPSSFNCCPFHSTFFAQMTHQLIRDAAAQTT
jgi:hypothetical protein